MYFKLTSCVYGEDLRKIVRQTGKCFVYSFLNCLYKKLLFLRNPSLTSIIVCKIALLNTLQHLNSSLKYPQLRKPNHLLFTVRISNNIAVHLIGWLYHALQALVNQWFPNYHIKMTSSDKFSLGSFLSQHRLLDRLQGRLHYTLTTYSMFLKQNKPF